MTQNTVGSGRVDNAIDRSKMTYLPGRRASECNNAILYGYHSGIFEN